MKSLRNIKLRTFCPNPVDLVMERSHNPLKRSVLAQRSPRATVAFLNRYKIPIDAQPAQPEP